MPGFVRIFSAVALSAVLQTLIFPVAGPLPQWRAQLAWVALVPWFVVLLALPVRSLRDGVRLALWSYLGGILWYFGHCYWVYDTMHQYGGLSVPMAALVLFLFCSYLGLYHALFGILVACARRRFLGRSRWMLLILPLVWVAVELARARVTSFPWDLLGYAQIDNAVLTRMAPWAGTYALSFGLAVVNAALALAWLRRDRIGKQVGLAAVSLACFLSIAGYVVHPEKPAATKAAVLVQPDLNVGEHKARTGPEESAETLTERLNALSEQPLTALPEGKQFPVQHPRIVLWPESPAPFHVEDTGFRGALTKLANETSMPVLAGALDVEMSGAASGKYRVYNAAALFVPGSGYAGRYSKIHLVPFGEFVPFADLFSFASGLTQAVGTFDRGSSRAPLFAQGHRYGVFICYESIFGDEVRQFVQQGADVLVNLSDDGWYGDTSAPFQHINMARMRAIENRRWILRDTNTGITASIDPYGTVREWAPRHVRTAVLVHFDYATAQTFYTRHGDLFAYLCAALTVVFVAVSLLQGSWKLD